jgi:hypothetical protein
MALTSTYLLLYFRRISAQWRNIVNSTESEVATLNWRKARRSATNGECVEIASTPGQVFVRDSKNTDGATLRYETIDWRRFIEHAKKADYGLGGLEF